MNPTPGAGANRPLSPNPEATVPMVFLIPDNTSPTRWREATFNEYLAVGVAMDHNFESPFPTGRRVARTFTPNGWDVSTVFLGVACRSGDETARAFETLAEGPPRPGESDPQTVQRRYIFLHAAVAGHEEVVRDVSARTPEPEGES